MHTHTEKNEAAKEFACTYSQELKLGKILFEFISVRCHFFKKKEDLMVSTKYYPPCHPCLLFTSATYPLKTCL